MHYLSKEWLDAANSAVQAQQSSAPLARLTIDQHVGTEVSYRVIVERDASSVTPIDDAHDRAAADAVFHQERETAVAIAQGDTDAHQAFLLGDISYSGDVSVLIERREAFDWLQATLTPLMADTSFD